MSNPRSLAALIVTALVLSACSGSSNGPAPTSSGTGGASTPASSGDLEAGVPFDRADVTFDVGGNVLIAAADQEAKARADARVAAGVADSLGPDSALLTAAMDAQVSSELAKLVEASATTAATGALTGSVFMPSGQVSQLAGIVPPGMTTVGTAVAADMLIDTSSPATTAYSKTNHDESNAAIGPNTGTITTDSTVTVTPSGSRLSVDVQTKVSGSVSDANGKLVYRIEGTAHAHIDLESCPAADGVAAATIDVTGDEYVFIASDGGRSGHSWKVDQHADVKFQADDQANLSQTKMDITSKSAVQGGSRAAGAGQSSLVDYTTGATSSLTMDRDFAGGGGGGTVTGHNATRADVDAAYGRAESTLGLAALTAGRAAEKFWRSGKCLEVVVNPNGGSVAANSKTTVQVKIRHRFDGTELTKPVQATLSGAKSIEPAGAALPAPASYTYTAGPKAGDAGSVTFRSVSNRGIGETTVTFTVGGGWTANRQQGEQTLTGQKCGGLDGVWTLVSTIKNASIDSTLTLVSTIDGTTLLGTYTYKSLVKSYPAIVTTGTGTGKASIVAQPDGTLLMTLAGTNILQVTKGAGTQVSFSVALPPMTFSWAPGGTCP